MGSGWEPAAPRLVAPRLGAPPEPRCRPQPPVQVYGLEGRYATALYSAATKQKKLEQVEKELLRVWVSSPAAAIYLGRGVPLPAGREVGLRVQAVRGQQQP